MVHKVSDFDPQAKVHEHLAKLHASHTALHDKFDEMLGHLSVIADAVKPVEGKPVEGNDRKSPPEAPKSLPDATG
jgi:hypothetical protein